jgi:hypothetical protein
LIEQKNVGAGTHLAILKHFIVEKEVLIDIEKFIDIMRLISEFINVFGRKS